MNYLIIEKISGFGMIGYKIRAELNGSRLPSLRYFGYTKRESEKMYRANMNLARKHILKVDF